MSGRPRVELEVLHEDNHVLAVHKPAGMPAVPDDSGDESLLERAKAWIAERHQKPGAVFLGVVHRLDRPVSGVLVFARTSKGAARLSESFRARAARKVYHAVVEGEHAPGEFELEQWLWKDEARNLVLVASAGRAGAQRALTRVAVLAARGGRSLVRLEPATGRPHQLRVACAARLAPILGDLKYGARAPLADACIALHASFLRLPHPTRAESLDLARLPDRAPFASFGAELALQDSARRA
ncbi:MAG: Ribosomal large subunit pseudouridine synthase [Planctomycetota bacterium]